jgi:photosystem II stability/assembly factor-like uncharacterized protein
MKNQFMLCRIFFSIILSLAMLSLSYAQVPTVNGTVLPSNPKYAMLSYDMASAYSGGVTTTYYCTAGGLYKTTNDGSTWTQITTLTSSPTAIACVANNPNTIYAADGSTYLKKSTNGGSSWVSIVGTIENLSISRITVAPSPDTQRIYVGCNVNGNYKTLWRSSNGGTTWFVVNSLNLGTVGITNIQVNPIDHEVVLATASAPLSSIYIGVWKSENYGQSFSPIQTGFQNPYYMSFTSLAINADGSNVYVATDKYGKVSTGGVVVWQSTDGGNTFTWKSTFYLNELDPCDIASSDMFITNSNNPYLAISSGGSQGGVWKSTDQGVSWSLYSDGMGLMYCHELSFLRRDLTRDAIFYAGSPSSFYMSSNSGVSWVEKNNGILTASSFSAVSIYDGNIVSLGSTLGNLCDFNQSTDGGNTWKIIAEEMPGTFQGGEVNVLPDGSIFASGKGEGWNCIPNNAIGWIWHNGDSYWKRAFSDNYGDKFSTSIYDPNNTSYLYLGRTYAYGMPYDQIHRSTDGGETWNDAQIVEYADVAVNQLVVDPLSGGSGSPSSILYAALSGASNGGIWKSTNYGVDWSRMTAFPSYYSASIALNPNNSQYLYAGTSNGYLYRSTNGGTSWSQVDYISNQNMKSVLVHPTNSSVIYAAPQSGSNFTVKISVDDGATWSTYVTLPARINQLKIDPLNSNVIYAATDNGIYTFPHTWSGTMAANTTWKTENSYFVFGQLTVNSSKTLTIQAGTTVKLYTGATLVVNGTLSASGTSGSHITFQPWNTSYTWSAVSVTSAAGSSASGTFAYCDFSKTSSYAVYSSSSLVTLDNCTFTNCHIGAGFNATNNNSHVNYCTFNTCGYSSIIEQSGSRAALNWNVITYGPRGIYLNNSSPYIMNNRVENCTGPYGVGCYAGSNPNIAPNGKNKFINNSTTQLFSESSSPFLGLIYAGTGSNCLDAQSGTYRITATLSSNIYAHGNYWGANPPPSNYFNIDGTSSVDRSYPQSSCQAQTLGLLAGLDLPADADLLTMARVNRMNNLYEKAVGNYLALINKDPEAEIAVIALRELRWTYHEYVEFSESKETLNELITRLQNMINSYPDSKLSYYASSLLANEYVLGQQPKEAAAQYQSLLDSKTLDDNIRLTALSEYFHLLVFGMQNLSDGAKILAILNSDFKDNEATELANLAMQMVNANQTEGGVSPSKTIHKVVAKEETMTTPGSFVLHQNYPNPFNPVTLIRYELPEESKVTVKIYNVLGQEISTLVNELQDAGYKEVKFDVGNLGSGVYFYRLQAGSFTDMKKMLVIK